MGGTIKKAREEIRGLPSGQVLLVNMEKNTAAYAAHKPIPYIMSNTFRDTFGMMGAPALRLLC